jgi:hypothetical protein
MEQTESGDNDKKERDADDQDFDEFHRTGPEGFLHAELLRIERL